MSLPLTWLEHNNLNFPPLEQALAEPNGLLAVGGNLSVERLKVAYNLGVFPWFNQGEPILWWYPSTRAVILTNALHVNKTTRKFLKKSPYQISINKAFDEVIQNCSNAPFRKEGTWISPMMKKAYIQLHQHGYAHSIEIWDNSRLVGGLYGVAINGFFSGESMFYQKDNASKLALIALNHLLRQANIPMIDCQLNNHFLASMGCDEISLDKFCQLKQQALSIVLPTTFWLPRYLSLNELSYN
ncbi:leucyl/phenylalanyl-tRNA--protein transferase [Thalassotalea ganghwensis]